MKIMLALDSDYQKEFRVIQQKISKCFGNEVPNLIPHFTLTIPKECQKNDDTYNLIHRVAKQVTEIAKPFTLYYQGIGCFGENVLFAEPARSEELIWLSRLVNASLFFHEYPLGENEIDRHFHLTLAKEFPNGKTALDAMHYCGKEGIEKEIIGFTETVNSISVFAKDFMGWREDARYWF